jgi:hypothetical protein
MSISSSLRQETNSFFLGASFALDLPSPPLSSGTRKITMIELFEARYPYIAKTTRSQHHDQAKNAATKTDSLPKIRARILDTRPFQMLDRKSLRHNMLLWYVRWYSTSSKVFYSNIIPTSFSAYSVVSMVLLLCRSVSNILQFTTRI